jgi:hypothetical protein
VKPAARPPFPTHQRTPFRPGDPRLVRFLKFRFWAYVVRHVFGVAVFAVLIPLALRDGYTLAAVLIAGLVVYGGFAAYSARGMWREWKAQERLAADAAREKGA